MRRILAGRYSGSLWPPGPSGSSALSGHIDRFRSIANPSPTYRVSALHAAVSIAILALSGCQATLPAVPGEVRIPVPVACIDKLPDKPALFTDEQLSKMGDGELIISLRIDQLNARGYIAQADALMQACIK